jgi:ribulose-phosphate 3-epimerase
MRRYQIAPSLLAADFSRLSAQLEPIEPYVDLLHLDVMDGHFVSNISFGMPVIASLRRTTSLTFDCHLMTTNPDAYLPELAAAGADLVTLHIEAVPDPTLAAKRAADSGLRFGLVLSPPTPFRAVEPFVELCDMLLVMSVHPGFGGQSFMSEVLPKLSEARDWVESHGLEVDIEIDGGISLDTIVRARDAGANVFVAGTAIFGSADPVRAVKDLREAFDSR